MKPTEAAWLGGIIDGEGSITEGGPYQGKKTTRWQLSAVNTDRRLLERCFEITGVGSILVKAARKEGHKELCAWNVTSYRNMDHILRQIRPFLVIKGEKADRFFAAGKT